MSKPDRGPTYTQAATVAMVFAMGCVLVLGLLGLLAYFGGRP